MKKSGFTLAEVLITLGIIGVVAALTTPALNSSFQKNKVGPSIRKMMTTVETINEHILADNDADVLSAVTNNDTDTYLEEFKKYAKGIIEEETLDEIEIVPKNIQGTDKNSPLYGTQNVYKIFTFEAGDAIALAIYAPGNLKGGAYKGNIGTLWYDINGYNTKPNRTGKDLFLFRIDNSGAVYPDGGKTQKFLDPGRDDVGFWWTEYGWGSCNEKNVQYGGFCGASVVDNNYKVIYKY